MDDIVNEVNYVEFLVISHPRTVQSSGGGGGGQREREIGYSTTLCRKCSLSEEKFRNLCTIVGLMSVSKYPPLSRLTAEIEKHKSKQISVLLKKI